MARCNDLILDHPKCCDSSIDFKLPTDRSGFSGLSESSISKIGSQKSKYMTTSASMISISNPGKTQEFRSEIRKLKDDNKLLKRKIQL